MSQLIPVSSEGAPVRQRPFTKECQVRFLQCLSEWGNVRAACKAAGVTRTTAYRLRRSNMRFEELWEGAQLLARKQVEEVLADRAIEGVEEQVFYHGEEVAMRRRYDARLLLAHLGRLDKLAQKTSARDAAMLFDQRLDLLEHGDACDEGHYEGHDMGDDEYERAEYEDETSA